MPEGHTVHRMARDQAKAFAGQTILVSSPQGRFENEARLLNKKMLVDVEAHGKHLFYQWANPKTKRPRTTTMHVHLGLYGKFRLHKNPPPEPRGAVRVRLIGDDRTMDLNGPTRCEILDKTQLQTLKNRLGQDPLRPDADPEVAWRRIEKTKRALGSVLLDQSVIAGIGNIYRAEILFLLGLDPELPGRELKRRQFDDLWRLTSDLLKIGVKYNRIITVPSDQVSKPPSRLRRDERVLVYKKMKCSRCSSPIRKFELGARTMYACRKCQK
jgi:endonuclease-8